MQVGTFVFKGLQIETGDVVAFIATSIPLPHVEAAVNEVKDGVLDVFSTLIAPFRHSGLFPESEISRIEIVQKAAAAIPLQSRAPGFEKDCRVATTIDGQEYHGVLVAAFDGIVEVISDDGRTIAGGSRHFRRVP